MVNLLVPDAMFNGAQLVFLGLETDDGFPFYPTPKLGDFGVAVRTSSLDGENPGNLLGCGTWGYFAPEQKNRQDKQNMPWYLRGRRGRLSAHTNVWGMGVIMYELLTLHQAQYALFLDESDPRGGIEGLSEIRTSKTPEYSDPLRTLIRECLRPDPRERPVIEEIQIQIGVARRHMASVGFTQRGSDKTTPHPDERLYYRGNEIESMEPGDWVPTVGRHVDQNKAETGFNNPSETPLMVPNWPTDEYDSDESSSIVITEVSELAAQGLMRVSQPYKPNLNLNFNFGWMGPQAVNNPGGPPPIVNEIVSESESVSPPSQPVTGVSSPSKITGDPYSLSTPKGDFRKNKYGRAAMWR